MKAMATSIVSGCVLVCTCVRVCVYVRACVLAHLLAHSLGKDFSM